MTGFITVNLKFITVHIARTVKLFPALFYALPSVKISIT
jgi:hypothetical protein